MTGHLLRRSVLSVLLLGVLAACGTAASPAPTPAAPAPDPTAASAPAPAPSTSSTPTPTSTTKAAPKLTAADGTNVSACRDGRCQIQVRAGTTIPLSPGLGMTSFKILDVSLSLIHI